MNKPLLEIIAVTYNHGYKLKCFINSIMSQTCGQWVLHIIHDGPGKIFDDTLQDLQSNGYLDDPRIRFSKTHKRFNLWGHKSREFGLENRISDAPYITITNCDNYYVPLFIESIKESLSEDKLFVYWDCVHNHVNPFFDREVPYGLLKSAPEKCKIDMGCASVKSDIAMKVGFPFTGFGADWKFFEACLQYISPDKIQKIPKILFVHN